MVVDGAGDASADDDTNGSASEAQAEDEPAAEDAVAAPADADADGGTSAEGDRSGNPTPVPDAATAAIAAAAIPAVGRTTLDQREEDEEERSAPMTRGPLASEGVEPSVRESTSSVPSVSASGPSGGETGSGDRVVERVVETRGPGFLPLVLGGLLAAGIGWGAHALLTSQGETVEPARVAALEAEVESLRGREPVDLTPLEGSVGDVDAQVSDLTARLDALEQGIGTPGGELIAPLRNDLDTLRGELSPLDEEVTGVADGLGDLADRVTAADEAVAALRSDLDALRSDFEGVPGDIASLSDRIGPLEEATSTAQQSFETLRTDLTDRMSSLEEQVAAMTETARDAEAEAEALAREAARNQLRVALETGGVGYAEQLDVLGGEVPNDLASNAEGGVPRLTTLQADFPPLARAALREARQAAPGGTGFRALLQSATNARSLEPRDGDDPDAVLSRAEAALREGDLETTLSEIQTLPTDAQAELGDWLTRARARLQAQRALDDYLSTTG